MDATIPARSLNAGVASQRCEANRVDFVFGLARNPRLVEEISIDLAWAEDDAARTGQPARRYKDFRWSTLDSWSRRRRVVGKAEWTRGEANPRFVVTSLKPRECDARILYERIHCARGDMENRIKECQLDLFAGRASAATMRANQLRLWFASMAYVLLYRTRLPGQWVGLCGLPEGLLVPGDAHGVWAAMAVLLDQPFGVVAGDEDPDGVADIADGLEDAAVHDLLFQGSKEPFYDTVIWHVGGGASMSCRSPPGLGYGETIRDMGHREHASAGRPPKET